ncbi:hypothetical protein ACFWBR_19100 [Streptomyces sp. NPDC060006]|uniref:hypothetical protein n=1 Tax=unclassified Streptomyces TaxID=2593676 RepID=UPI0036955AE3
MDQATAVVLASAVAGFSSAAGAALGSVMAGRSTREQIDRTAQREKLTRHEVDLEERFSGFRDKVNEAMAALHDVAQALADDQPVTEAPARKAYVAAYTSFLDDLWPSGHMEVIQAAGSVCNHLNNGVAAIGALAKTPHEAKDPDSQGMQHWGSCLGDISNSYQTTSRLMGEVLRKS